MRFELSLLSPVGRSVRASIDAAIGLWLYIANTAETEPGAAAKGHQIEPDTRSLGFVVVVHP